MDLNYIWKEDSFQFIIDNTILNQTQLVCAMMFPFFREYIIDILQQFVYQSKHPTGFCCSFSSVSLSKPFILKLCETQFGPNILGCRQYQYRIYSVCPSFQSHLSIQSSHFIHTSNGSEILLFTFKSPLSLNRSPISLCSYILYRSFSILLEELYQTSQGAEFHLHIMSSPFQLKIWKKK